MSPANDNADRVRQLAVDLAARAMLAALRKWKCGSCGGSGKYQPNATNTRAKLDRGAPLHPRFNPPAVPCKVCGGRKLHPTATAAIAQAEAAGIGSIGQLAKDAAAASDNERTTSS